jgi:Zn-dependent peptidase ImmA (M78 family)
MGCYYTKAGLYKEINHLRDFVGIDQTDYPINLINMCKVRGNILVEAVPFNTPGLKGMASIASREGENDIILLNSYQSEEERNFICGHELIHLALHRHEKVKSFNCFEKILPNQDGFLEWQANEGSAEFIVPYQLFLPKIKKSLPSLKTSSDYRQFRRDSASSFNVTDAVIKFRLDDLKYEIQQYLNGTSINSLEFLSKNQRVAKGINVKSLSDVEDELFRTEYHIYFGDRSCLDIAK